MKRRGYYRAYLFLENLKEKAQKGILAIRLMQLLGLLKKYE